MLDTAERLREVIQEETFGLLFLNDKAQRKGEFIFNSKCISKQVKTMIKQNMLEERVPKETAI